MPTCPICAKPLETVRQREDVFYTCVTTGSAMTLSQGRHVLGDSIATKLLRLMKLSRFQTGVEWRTVMPPRKRFATAFTVTDLLVVIGLLMLLATMLLAVLPRLRRGPVAQKITCVNNLKQIGLSFRTWALDNSDHFPMRVSVTNGGTMELVGNGTVFPHFEAMSNELNTPVILHCPEDKKRTCAANFTNDLTDKKISYFVGLDSCDDDPLGILAGDRNLTNAQTPNRVVILTTNTVLGWTKEVHRRTGHLLFADGSVDSFTNGLLSASSRVWSAGTNRLAIP